MKYLLPFFLLTLSNYLTGQEVWINNKHFLERIFSEKLEDIIPIQIKHNQLIPLERNFENYSQHLIRTKDEFKIIVDGTGRVYNATHKLNDTIFFQRIDSTHFYGYNGESINFLYRDTIFSYGGFGYWRMNGQLRYYNEKFHEWDLVPLNDEIPSLNKLYFFDRHKAELYFLQTPFIDYATNNKKDEFLIYKLSLSTRKIKKIGTLKNEFSSLIPEKYTAATISINTLKGILVDFGLGNQFLINLIHNKIYRLNSSILKNIFSGSSKNNQILYAFEKNNWLYYTRSKDTSMEVDSVSITMDDFTLMDTPFYEPETNNQSLFVVIGIGLFALIGTSVYFYRRKKNKIIETENSNEEIEIDGFKSTELDLIEKIYKKTLEGKSYSVEDINTSLGLSKKSLEIQKKIRTETINRINHRFKLKFNTEEDLIERVRLEEDRRFYKYLINEENGKKALGL